MAVGEDGEGFLANFAWIHSETTVAEADDEDPDGGQQRVAAEVDLAFGRVAVTGRAVQLDERSPGAGVAAFGVPAVTGAHVATATAMKFHIRGIRLPR